MLLKVFSVFDNKSGTYSNPWYARTIGEAIRSFSIAANDKRNPDNLISRFPIDYALFEIGSFDDVSGVIVKLDVLNCIGLASEYVDRDSVPSNVV